MRQDKIVHIGGTEYTIHQFPAIEGMKLGLELVKRAAPLLIPAIPMFTGAQLTPEMSEGFSRAIVEHLDPDVAIGFIQRLCACVEAKGSGALGQAFEIHFAGRLADVIPLAAEVVEHNLKDFLKSALDLAKNRAERLSSPSPTA